MWARFWLFFGIPTDSSMTPPLSHLVLPTFCTNKINDTLILIQSIHYKQNVIQGQFLSRIHIVGLNSEFSFSYIGYHVKAKQPCLPCYLPIAGSRRKWLMPFPKAFPKALKTRKKQTVLFGLTNSFPTMITIIP